MLRRALLAALIVAMAVTPALAAPVPIESDNSDNLFSFTYNGASGDIERASSSRILRRRDKVAFLLYIRERADAPVGERLVARIELDLLAEKALRYRGSFSFEVSDALGKVVYTGTRDANFVLRPRAKQRTEVLRIPFDLASGEFTAVASFDSGG